MIGNVLLLTLAVFVASCLVAMERLKFLVPYRHAMFVNYGWAIGLYALVLFGNLFATMFVVARRFSLKHTGQKLVYVDQQLRIGSDDLADEIRERSEERS
jgi:hypothetical protein